MIRGTGAGFFSNMRGTLGALSKIKNSPSNDSPCYIDWSNTLYGAWENFFHQVDFIPDFTQMKYLHDQDPLPRDPSTKLILHETYKNNVRVRQDILDKMQSTMNQLTDNTLAVHIRRTDKLNCTRFGEPESGKPVDLELYVKHSKEELESHDKIFLATDDKDVVECFRKEFGKSLIVRDDCVRSRGDVSIHHSRLADSYKMGSDVLIDCLLMSQCRTLIKGISNVALFALFINKDLRSINLNSIYNGDTREDFAQ